LPRNEDENGSGAAQERDDPGEAFSTEALRARHRSGTQAATDTARKQHDYGTGMPLFVPLATSQQRGVMTTLFGQHSTADLILLDEAAAKQEVSFDDIGNSLAGQSHL